MFTQWKKVAATLSTAALLSISPGVVSAQEHSHAHGAEPAQLTLNNGKKWTTDANLRQGMSRIRDALTAELPAIHSGKATTEQYRALAQKTNGQITFMVKKLQAGAESGCHAPSRAGRHHRRVGRDDGARRQRGAQGC